MKNEPSGGPPGMAAKPENFVEMRIDDVIPTPDNPRRKIDLSDASFRERGGQVRPRLQQQLQFYQVQDLGERHVRACERIAELVGLDYHELMQQVVMEIPEPKRWAKAVAPVEVHNVKEAPVKKGRKKKGGDV
ncbi:MAG: hypothetical protein KA004_19015 [Verrucomicrobiales bacterium]|nr:hypothetical protein [Verrucomicrobiales bacterium]